MRSIDSEPDMATTPSRRAPSTEHQLGAATEEVRRGVTNDSALLRALTALVWPVRIIAGVVITAGLVIGKSVFIPLALAVLCSLALRPLVRALSKHGAVPAPLTSALLTLAIGLLLGSALYSLAEPAKEWLRDAPQALRTLQRQAETVRGPLDDMRETSAVISELRGTSSEGTPELVISTEPAVEESVVARSSEIVAYAVATLVMLFFILGWGDRLFRNALALLPGFGERRGVVEIVQGIESAIARYLVTITIINMCLGAAVALLAYFLGLPNAALWGVVAALGNFMPYIGAVLTTSVLLAVSLVTQPLEYNVLAAPVLFLVITTLEGYLLTPYAVGRSLTLNPLVIFFSMFVCFFLWGGIGALLAVPILVCAKVALEASGATGTVVARVLS